ncbi:uncharacterized protein MAM_06588 [Metarhizium album ARSEF 1941]|uniref:Uncharacterized protein n=1 Tax=Metarhizium album (strain ARSEF 1941) TaxID=1081103 RepID=A0A0B2WHN6_METAS|nr:uncharacterized protein MAM_06588 [Metarhizium album ARSEF 1941]KHN95531.1 hypothetical protein MAM_06588 [Metarhizium album ARSEF 1941]
MPSLEARPAEMDVETETATATAGVINTRKMRYTGLGLRCLKSGGPDARREARRSGKDDDDDDDYDDVRGQEPFSRRYWSRSEVQLRPSPLAARGGRRIGRFPLTSRLAGWVREAFASYRPSARCTELVRPFGAEFHALLERERAAASGLHDLDLVELTYQVTLEVGAEILLAAHDNGNAGAVQAEFHSSRAARDEHFAPWGRLLTGLECDPPIIAQFPFYLMMCQAFGLEADSSRENYVYAALTGVNWARGANAYSERFRAFEEAARAAVPGLDDGLSGRDRSFWRVSLGYLAAMNGTENARALTTPRASHIATGLDPRLLTAARGFDTIGSAYMCSDGAAYLDDAGMDALVGSAVPNDVMDLHTDMLTGETRNLLRLLYPSGRGLDRALDTMATVLAGMLCELFRGHKRARLGGREDGRIAATSPPYSFCRARHRRIFEVLEAYVARHGADRFWSCTRDLLRRARAQVTGVRGDLARLVGRIHDLWHAQLLAPGKEPGWGRRFDRRSDDLFRQAGELLGRQGRITPDVYRFAIAYGRLSMALPYVAYHTVDALIMAYGPCA